MWVGRAELAAAVSNAGGLGLITAFQVKQRCRIRNPQFTTLNAHYQIVIARLGSLSAPSSIGPPKPQKRTEPPLSACDSREGVLSI